MTMTMTNKNIDNPSKGEYARPSRFVSIYDNEQAEPEYLLRYGANGLLSRGDIVVIAGREKSGKSTFAKVLVAACVGNGTHGFTTSEGEPLKVYIADTEQAMGNVMANMISVQRMANIDDATLNARLKVSRYRGETRTAIMESIEQDVRLFKPDLVLLDGFAELVLTMNDAETSKVAAEYIMRISEQYRCCVATIIHLNRTGEGGIDDVSGHAGSYLLKKQSESFVVNRPQGGGASTIKQEKSRNDDFPVLSMLIEGTGTDKTITIGKLAESSLDNEKAQLRELFQKALGDGGEATATELDKCIISLTGMSKSTAKRRRDNAVKLGVLFVVGKGRKTLYYLKEEPTPEHGTLLDDDSPLL